MDKMELEKELDKSLNELRKTEPRKFSQTVDLIINLQKYDLKKNALNLFIPVPHKIKDKKICAFLEVKNKDIETVTREEFRKYSDKKQVKLLANKFDFFIAQASIMPSVATTFGRALGPSGKMPSPQIGILENADERTIKELIARINKSVKIRTKESSIKLAIGNEKMSNQEIIENIMVVYNAVLKALSKGKENLRNIEVKFTMTKPYKIRLN